MEDWHYIFKILIIGDSSVGKSCLLYRFADDVFYQSFMPTIGVDFKIRTIDVTYNEKAKLEIWDTAGQDRFMAITTSYYRGADGILLVYDVTNPESFKNLDKWITEIRKHAKEDVDIVLVGNKSDLNLKRSISYETGLDKAKTNGLHFFETSAKDSRNVEEAFRLLAKNIHSRKRTIPTLTTTKPQQNDNIKKLETVNVNESASGCYC